MTLVQFLRIIAGKIRFIIIVPLFPAILVFLLTMNDVKEYKSGTLIFTGLASTPDALENSNTRIDNYAVNNSFDNLLNLISSREILERTGLKLLALQLQQTEPKQGVIGEDLFKQLQKLADANFRKGIIVNNDPDSTFAHLWHERSTPSIRSFTDNDKLPYSPEYIEANLKMKRAGISDMLEMSYASYDAASTQQTLKILTGIFMSEYKSLKSQDAQNLVTFFSQETETAETRLNAIAAELKEYRISNGIINYDEQTKQLTVEEMYMNGELREELRKYAASEASLTDLNLKLGNRSERIANNQTIVDLREQLAKASSELLTGCFFLTIWLIYGFSWFTPIYMLAVFGLLLGTFIDLEHMILPDRVTIGGMILFPIISTLFPLLQGEITWMGGLKDSLIGLAAGFGALWVVREAGTAALKKEAMGFGDVKLMGALGALFGWEAVIYIIFFSAMIGSIAGITLIALQRKGIKSEIPYGPYIALAAFSWMLGGFRLWDAYLAIMGF